MDFGNFVPLYNHHYSEDYTEFPCPQRFPHTFRGWYPCPSPHSTSRSCYVNFLALFRWHTWGEGSKERDDGQQMMASSMAGHRGQTVHELCFSNGHVVPVHLSVGDNTMFCPKWSSWGYEVTGFRMQCHGYSCWILGRGRWPLEATVSSPNVLTTPWWQSFLFTHEQPLRTCFPHHWWYQRLNTHLLLHLQVRLVLFYIMSSEQFFSFSNEWVNEYVSLRVYNVTGVVYSNKQSWPSSKLTSWGEREELVTKKCGECSEGGAQGAMGA